MFIILAISGMFVCNLNQLYLKQVIKTNIIAL